jgi:exodeoxyribonuclease V beta subunit
LLAVAAVYASQVDAINAIEFTKAAFLKLALGKYSDLLEAVQALLNKPATLPALDVRPLEVQRNALFATGILDALSAFRNAVNEQNIEAFIAYGNRYIASESRSKSIKSRQFNDMLLALKGLSTLGTMDTKDWARLKRVAASGQIGKSKVTEADSLNELELVRAARLYFEQYFDFEKLADAFRQQVVLFAFHAAKDALLDGNNLAFSNTSLSYTRTVQLAAQGLRQYPFIAEQLKQRFPVALIDEFQDTDPTQAAILNAIYPEAVIGSQKPDDFAVVMVGDPKQAIYNFRGADVYAYLNAKQSARELFSLDTNQRSVAPLVDEVNALFSALPDVFDVPGIDFVSMKASGKHVPTLAEPAFRYVVTPESKSKFDVWRWVALEIASLLRPQTNAGSQTEGLKAQDIAVLVSSNKNALLMRDALSAIGLQSRVEDRTSIWSQPMALYLLWFLQGVHFYTNAPSLKKALLTPLGGELCTRLYPTEQLQDLTLVRAANERLLSEFALLNQIWLTQGFSAFWHSAFPKPATNSDLRHLLELLNSRVPLLAQPPHDVFGLIQWLEAQVKKGADESPATDVDRRRSLAADVQVQISTIHASKGLQYEVVFLPDLVGRSDPRAGRITYFEKDLKLAVDLSASEFQAPEVSQASAREHEREELRLAYVAVTRAVQACYVLLPSSLIDPPPKKGKVKSDRRMNAMVKARVKELQKDASNKVQLAQPAQDDDVEHHSNAVEMNESIAQTERTTLVELPWQQVSQAWIVDSFTALARRSANENHAIDLVEKLPARGDLAEQAAIEFDPHFGHDIEALPKGARTGECLHAILENTRWASSLAEGSNFIEVQKQASRYDIARDQSLELASWLDDVLRTPLINDFCLKDIAPEKMIREWRFDNLQEKSNSYLRGYVDLVFEHQQKFYVIDYKSNWLGADDNSYAGDAIARSMQEHQYDLQAKIYSAALKNFLASRLGADSVSSVYGGVLYLYLRAMKSSAPGFGVLHVA